VSEFVLGTDPEIAAILKKTKRIRTVKDVLVDTDPHSKKSPLGANAIGVDGDRDTASIEFRPGISTSGEDLVNRLATLVGKLRSHWHPPGIAYVSGPWVDPEPLGGHGHFSWPVVKADDYSDQAWRVLELLRGLRIHAEYLVPKLFDPTLLKLRVDYAVGNNRDFASPGAYRPGTLEKVMLENHLEYRYPPSWMMTPEAAFCFLGGWELIGRKIFQDCSPGARVDWQKFVEQMFEGGGIAPPNSMNLRDAFAVAVKHKTPEDFSDNWI
jgi:hypothetical protein